MQASQSQEASSDPGSEEAPESESSGDDLRQTGDPRDHNINVHAADARVLSESSRAASHG